jgi:hypothetical protein
MLDETDFEHSIGEAELEAEDVVEAHREINAFLDKYPWFFQKERPKGKLTAYFERFPFQKHSYSGCYPEIVRILIGITSTVLLSHPPMVQGPSIRGYQRTPHYAVDSSRTQLRRPPYKFKVRSDFIPISVCRFPP